MAVGDELASTSPIRPETRSNRRAKAGVGGTCHRLIFPSPKKRLRLLQSFCSAAEKNLFAQLILHNRLGNRTSLLTASNSFFWCLKCPLHGLSRAPPLNARLPIGRWKGPRGHKTLDACSVRNHGAFRDHDHPVSECVVAPSTFAGLPSGVITPVPMRASVNDGAVDDRVTPDAERRVAWRRRRTSPS